MRTYIIILGDIFGAENDRKFVEFINKHKLEYWRYTPLNWILFTPDEFDINTIVTEAVNAYGFVFQVVLEIDIKDAGGVFQNIPIGFNSSPLTLFKAMKEPGFKPRWEREKA